VLLPGVLDFEPFGDVFASGIVFRSLPLLPGVLVLAAPDDDEPEDIPPEEL
jgi:hypothetical protein